jgi:tetratricopeptide (TPR) repeat protein
LLTLLPLCVAPTYAFANLVISRVKVEDRPSTPLRVRASLRAAVDSMTTNVQTKQTRKERMIRSFAFVKEADVWKVWRYYPAVEDLVRDYLGAKTEEDRRVVLQSDRELAPQLGQGLHTYGHSRERAGDYAGALKVWTEWLKLAEGAADKHGSAEVLNDIGSVHSSQGNYAQAMEFYEKSLTIAEAMDHSAGIAATLYNMADVYKSQGNYAKALELYQKSLKLEEELGNKAYMADALNNIGVVHKSLGNYAQALKDEAFVSYRKAIAHLECGRG